MSEYSVQLRDKGVLHLPISLRRKYNVRPGDVFTLIELGDSGFVLALQASRLAGLGDKVAEMLNDAGLSMEDVLQMLDEERERYYADHYIDRGA